MPGSRRRRWVGVRAKTTNRSAIGALVMNRFCPLMTQPSPSRGARCVRRPAGSEPAPGSVSANEATTSPAAIRSSHRFFCSSVPNPTSTWPAMPLLVPNMRAERQRRVAELHRELDVLGQVEARARPTPGGIA